MDSRQQPSNAEPSITYFMFDGEHIKIGKSKDTQGVYLRQKTLQTGNPRKIEIVGITNIPERIVHARFKSSRLSGEWFSVSADLLRFLSSHAFAPNCIAHVVGMNANPNLIEFETIVETHSDYGKMLRFLPEALSPSLYSSMRSACCARNHYEIPGVQWVMEYEHSLEHSGLVFPKAFYHVDDDHQCELSRDAIGLIDPIFRRQR